MTTATQRPFRFDPPANLPFAVQYPDISLGPDALLEHTVAARRLGIEKRLVDAAESVNANPYMTADGMIATWTEKTAVPALRELNEDLKALMGMEVALLARGQALVAQQIARMPAVADGERVALVQAFRESPRDIKARAVAAATAGKDPVLARALTESHLLLSGMEEFEMESLRSGMLDHLDQAPAVARERAEIEHRVVVVRGETQMLENLRQAIIAQSDRSKLTPEVLPRKANMTREQATLYIVDFGLEAYQQLMD